MRALLLTLVACGTPVDVGQIELALPAASRSLEVAFHRTVIGPSGFPVIVRVEQLGAVDGYFDGDTIVINDTVAGHAPGAVLMHEIGHALGLGHNDEPNNIMNSCAADVPIFEAAHQLAALCITAACREKLTLRILQ